MPTPPTEVEKTSNGRSAARSEKAAKAKNGNGNGGRTRVVLPSATNVLNRRQLLAALRALRRGEFDIRMPESLDGVDGQICDAFNELVALVGGLGDELSELREAVGQEGRT